MKVLLEVIHTCPLCSLPSLHWRHTGWTLWDKNYSPPAPTYNDDILFLKYHQDIMCLIPWLHCKAGFLIGCLACIFELSVGGLEIWDQWLLIREAFLILDFLWFIFRLKDRLISISEVLTNSQICIATLNKSFFNTPLYSHVLKKC